MADNQDCDTDSLLKFAGDGDLEKIESCKKAGADIFVADKNGKSIYTVALENGNHTLARNLQDYLFAEWLKEDRPLRTEEFYMAIAFDNVKMMNPFIEAGFDIQAKDDDGVVPVVYAVFNNSNRALELLLVNHADVAYEFDFRPLICIAAMFNQQETVAILLKYGALVDDRDGSDVTPLMFAARDGYTDLARYLLSKGADKSARDVAGNTALDMAVKANKSAMVELLSE